MKMLRIAPIVAAFALLAAALGATAAPADLDINNVLRAEREVSVLHGRTIVCLLGYTNCGVALNILREKELPAKTASYVAIVAPYQKKTSFKGVTILTLEEVLALKAGRPDGKKGVMSPDWAKFLPEDQKFYQAIWRDGELRITHFMGHRDLGVGKNPDTFMYGSYALELDKLRYFASQWGLATREVDELETELIGTIGPGRTVRIRIVDANVFCASEQERIDVLERDVIERDPRGFIRAIEGRDTLKRDLDCAVQEEASAEAKRRLFETLADPSEDMVFYQGHSRFGRGPDFGPFSRKVGKVSPKELIGAIVDSSVAVMYFNGCSGGKNYGTLIKQATESGKTMIWNEKAPNRLDGVDDILLFTQSIFERRSLRAIERYMNLTQERGDWANTVKVTVATDRGA
ncbi:MAG TPA: hypothetical protein VFK86_03670 [Bauldia sp.]|nr:hypothetical protein [Bauldia sp.]